jgi:hypothetical protein
MGAADRERLLSELTHWYPDALRAAPAPAGDRV